MVHPNLMPGARYHHLGIPTSEPRPGERYVPHLDIWVEGFETSPFGVEWVRFGPRAQVPELVRRVPHVAFEVDDLAAAMAGHRVLIAPNAPSEGVLVGFIEHNGAPVEFLQITRPDVRPASP